MSKFADQDFGPMQQKASGVAIQRVKPPKDPKPVKLGEWRPIFADEAEFTTWVRTVENLSRGRVRCQTRGGADLIVPQNFLGQPQTRKRPRQS